MGKDECNKAYNLLTETCKSYKSDITLLLKSNCDYVQDGTRWEQEQETREKHYQELKDLYDKFNIKYIEVNQESWEDKLNFIEKQVDNVLSI